MAKGEPNKHLCSTGKEVSNSTINRNLTLAYRKKHAGEPSPRCECKGVNCEGQAVDNDHTISQKQLKYLGLTDYIWDPAFFVSSCRKCHQEWENLTGGMWQYHVNLSERMRILKENYPEMYEKRKQIIEHDNVISYED